MKQLSISLISLLFLLVCVPMSFAAQVSVEGKLVDQYNNPIPQGSIVFQDASGKTVAAAVADFSGKYKANMETGTYTVIISGPQGSSLVQKTLPDHRIEQATMIDFTLEAPKVVEAKKPSLLEQFFPFVIGGLVLAGSILGYTLWRKKKSPKSGSSD